MTNTNWQSYSGESTMGHLAQMAGLAVQNFASAAVGMAAAVALIRRFTRSRTNEVGNFWVDLTRGCLRILLPLAVVGTIALVALGAVQNFSAGTGATTLAGIHQSIPGVPLPPRRPSRSSAPTAGTSTTPTPHTPFENPNPLSNFLEIFFLLLLLVSRIPGIG